MDRVPALFIESVCLRFYDRQSLRRSAEIGSLWGKITTVSQAKIYTLRVRVDPTEGKLYAAAQKVHCWDHRRAVPLDRVDLTSITNFRIDDVSYGDPLPSSWREISLDELGRLARFIRPTGYERRPICYTHAGSNRLRLTLSANNSITGKLISLRLPVDSISLSIYGGNEAEVEEFFAHAGPLYDVSIIYGSRTRSTLKQSTVDMIIDKYVPAHHGGLRLDRPMTREQLERLVVKCEMSGEQIGVDVVPEESTKSLDATELFDCDKYQYSTKKVEPGELHAIREGGTLFLNVLHGLFGSTEWIWSDIEVFQSDVSE
uniref:Integrase catalytic domain-containing protein n=1 Tax=Steinernema glaseri TaxID=37863 RepID=A0A1I7YPD4_9BILA